MRILLLLPTIAFLILIGCMRPKPESAVPLSELSAVYSEPKSEWLYSENVKDSFRIFHSIPEAYAQDTAKAFPLILLLDANAYIEPVVAQLKFATFIGQIPPAVVIGIGYSDFQKLNSYRDRDYTFPKMNDPDWERSGGAMQFSRFIDNELVPVLKKRYRIDWTRSVISGHSLGGYFTLFYATHRPAGAIRHAVCASPSLEYASGYIFKQISDSLDVKEPSRIYVSMGSLEMGGDSCEVALTHLKDSFAAAPEHAVELKTVLYSGFRHMDAAIPGMMKGFEHVLRENDDRL